ncbi:MAG: thioredoxin domain-containing protein [Candidatus Aminicenantes bacterium]|nr:thioredoxin domain-containing protein [Candidatus Aminicenantes bacterium]
MADSLTLEGAGLRRFWSFVAGAGMITASVLTIRHFFLANFPESIFQGSFCDLTAFFNCDSSAYSSLAHFRGVPMGYFGLFAGALVVLGALFPSVSFERTNRFLAFFNALGVVGLFIYTVFFLKSLCLLCGAYYVFSLLNFFLFWRYGLSRNFPSLKLLAVFAIVALTGAYGFQLFYEAKKEAQLGGVAMNVVKEYYSLGEVKNPSIVSPFWTAKATERFEDAPIRVIEYADFLCPDCLYLYRQLERLGKEYNGKLNVAFQHFPLEAECNTVVEKDRHPGACDLALIASYDPAKFKAIHDEIFENFQKARSPEWRAELARKYDVEAALTDQAVRDLVKQIINTGAEYEKTSEEFAHGIRSTPTLIVNNRMIIGTLPYAHLKAIFESLLSEGAQAGGKGRFMENWVDLRPKKKPVRTPSPKK